MVNAISKQVLDLWNRYKPTIAVDAIEYDVELKKLLGTSLASLGTDCISRQQAIDALAKDMPQAYTPDGSHPADEGIFMAQEIYADCIQTLKELPSAQPEIIRCKDCLMHGVCRFEQGLGLDGYCSQAERRTDE